MEMQVDSRLIRSEREKRAWSQSHLAEVAGLGLRTVQRIEGTGSASFESAAAIASAFSINVSELVSSDRATDAASPQDPRKRFPGARTMRYAALAMLGAAALVYGLVQLQDSGNLQAQLPDGESSALAFTDVESVAQLDALLSSARAGGRPAMVYVTADWCVSCASVEAETFASSAVAAALESFALLRVDVTAFTDEDRALMAELDAVGAATMRFFDRTGAAQGQLVGYVSPRRFLDRLPRIVELREQAP